MNAPWSFIVDRFSKFPRLNNRSYKLVIQCLGVSWYYLGDFIASGLVTLLFEDEIFNALRSYFAWMICMKLKGAASYHPKLSGQTVKAWWC